MTLSPLQTAILAARDRGDQRELERLRAEYRRSGELVAAERGTPLPPIRVVDRAGGRSATTGQGKRPASRTSSRSSMSSTAWTSSWEPVLRSDFSGARSWPVVKLASDGVAESVRDCSEWVGVESGRWLIGRLSWTEILITDVVGYSLDADATHSSCVLEPEQAQGIQAQLSGSGRLVCGDIHCHPRDDHVRPSAGDMRAWQNMLLTRHLAAWLGIIVSDRGGIYNVALSATLLRQEEGRVVHRQVALKGW